jgi:hypothetical protein
MRALLEHWAGWLGLGATFASLAALLAGASWIPGVGLALRIAIAGLEAISPLINGFFAAIIWVWAKILWPGALNIMSQWSSIFTVIIMGVVLWVGLIARYEAKLVAKGYVISQCKSPVEETEPVLELPWPFNWK